MSSRRTTEILVDSSVLIWAREQAGLTATAAAESLGEDDETLTRIENGDLLPSRTLLRKMSRVYKRPYAVLLMPEAPEQVSIPTDFRMLPGSGDRPYGPELAIALREARKYQDALSDIIADDTRLFPEFRPNIQIPRNMDETNFEEIGRQINDFLGASSLQMRQWNATDRAFRHWRGLLEAVGVLVIVEDIPREEARGFSLWGED